MSKLSFSSSHKLHLTHLPLSLAVLGMLAYGLYFYGLTGPISMIESEAIAQVPDQEPALDATTYYAIERLRNEVGLTHRDLCASGCGMSATSGALTNLLAWYQSNKSSLYTARNAELAARKRLNETAREASEAELESLAQAVITARAGLAVVHAEAVASTDAALTQGQRDRLSAARENKGVVGALRYVPGLSETQRQLVLDAQSIGSDSESVLSAALLSSNQRQALADVRTDLKMRSLEVVAGEQFALPVPPEVQAGLELDQLWITEDE